MFKDYLIELLQKNQIHKDEVERLVASMDLENKTNLSELITDKNFCKTLLDSKAIVPVHENFPLNFIFLIQMLGRDSSYFPLIMKNEPLKQLFIQQSYAYRTKNLEFPFFSLVLARDKADENLKLILEDNELKKLFCKSNCAGRVLIEFSKSFPRYIKTIITHPELKIAITKDRGHSCAIRDILYCSHDKRDADTVFADSTFGDIHDEFKTDIYNVIANNYRKSLPDSLFKLCLFAVTKSAHLPSLEKVPNELQEAIKNFSINGRGME